MEFSIANCQNGTTIPSILGLNYTQHCNGDLPGGDIGNSILSSFEECIEKCTRHKPGCYGLVWDSGSKRCWHKDSSVSTRSLRYSLDLTSALVFPSQIKHFKNAFQCPYPNLSQQKTTTGAEFTIYCGADFDGGIMYQQGTGTNPSMHADNLQGCLENCAKNHPLCTRVTYSADFARDGWLNCWIRTGDKPKLGPVKDHMAHSAYAPIPKIDSPTCKNGSTTTIGDGRIFKASCPDKRGLDGKPQPLETYHESSIEDCTTRCTNSSSTCSALVFDAGLQSGFQNCYLFDSIPSPSEQCSDHTLLYHDSISAQYKPPPARQSSPSNKNWIAAAVLCPLILAIIIYYLFWGRKGKPRKFYAAIKRHKQ
ncbi:hypothetical protein BJ875DRAFT_200679 [Amylocarpus encephaloides]|uniref:Apple domain-containing protein n=1 Tax=Amylocarpus encephaloides TaxID=45428 RepID=A0A9P8C0X3_9HELO|nr:hypothetical protein BJ875DRAFT_200679 [Amylocarpus encephaloides]